MNPNIQSRVGLIRNLPLPGGYHTPYVSAIIIISDVNSFVCKTTHKYGVDIPNLINHAHELNLKNGNDVWITSIKKEMSNVGIAFEILGENKISPVKWPKESGQLIYNLKMDYTRKSRWVLDGHRSAYPDGCTYAGVVSRDSVHIALIYVAINDIGVLSADIQNVYLQSTLS